MEQMIISIPRQAGLYVRRTREAQGQTRAQLARAARVSERLLASLELGDAPGIQLDKLLAVCHALGLKLCLQHLGELAPEVSSEKVPESESDQALVSKPEKEPTPQPFARQRASGSEYSAAWDEFMAAQGVCAPSPLADSSSVRG